MAFLKKNNEKKEPVVSKTAKKKQFKNGSYTILYSAIAVAVVVFLNLIIGTLPTSVIHSDLSTNKLYTISEQTESIVKSLEDDITIYFITTENRKDNTIDQMLKKYDELSSHVTVKQIDPTTNPYFIRSYTDETLYLNSVIVESDVRYKVLNYTDIYQNTYEFDMSTGNYNTVTNYDGENQVTGAIDFVLTDEIPVIYILDGNGEAALPDTLVASIERQNIDTEPLNLLSASSIPQDAEALIMFSPASDITQEQYDILLPYLERGGRLLLFTDFANGVLPNLGVLMNNYGVESTPTIVMEADTQHYVPDYNYYLLPIIESHDITVNLTDGRYILAPLCHPIKELDSYRNTITVSPLLSTTDQAYAKISPQTMERESGDEGGPFHTAVAISETVGQTETRIVWISASTLAYDQVDKSVGGSNSIFILGAVNWLCDEKTSDIVIDAKALTQEQLTLTASQATMWAVIMMVILPLASIVAGIVIFVHRRRH